MTRPVLGLMLVLGCGPRGPSFVTDVDASALNGFWSSRQDGGRPIGVVIFDLPSGPAWSPHGLLFENSSLYITHDCRDFQLDANGVVRPVTGIKPIGGLSYAAGGARLEWKVSAANWQSLLSSSFPDRAGARHVDTFDAGIVVLDAGTVELSFQILRVLSAVDGGPYVSYFADGGLEPGYETVGRTLMLERAAVCP